MNKLFLTLTFLLIACPAWADYRFAENWSKTDTAYEVVYVGLTIIDWGQTRNIVREHYEESNIILGKHPSMSEVDTYIPLAIVAHAVIAAALPPKYRRYWQVLWIGVEAGATINNAKLGLRIEF
jgi:hypothetical protein